MTQHPISILLKWCVRYKGRRVERVQKIASHSEDRLKHIYTFFKSYSKAVHSLRFLYQPTQFVYQLIAHTYVVQTLKDLLQHVSAM
jgi:hypothetical protein